MTVEDTILMVLSILLTFAIIIGAFMFGGLVMMFVENVLASLIGLPLFSYYDSLIAFALAWLLITEHKKIFDRNRNKDKNDD